MARADAGERLRRLLAVLAWLAREGRAPVGELAERFNMDPSELVADLELAACCGLPPYTPDQLMEIVVDEDEVVAHLGPELASPRRLSEAEGLALAAAGRALAAVPGNDPGGALSRALGKLEAVLGRHDGLRVELGEPPQLAAVRAAAEQGRQLRLQYHSAGRDELTDRVVDPQRVVSLDGHWYLDAFCHRADGPRRFRVDRILTQEPTGQAVDHEFAPPADERDPFVPGPDSTVVQLLVDDQAAWVADAVPTVASRPAGDGTTELSVAVANPVWFGRLLLRLGRHARVLDPPDMAEVGREAAREVLARYRPTPAAPA